ncbi:MAG: DUF393 domain-containing protein, partial [Verrucomicrobia bacterium]|nr:DUF393 domain-containing protein [Verrucomicrobiota bacterium]
MKSNLRVAAPPSRPVMVFDHDCRFCRLWIRRWRQITGEAVEYLAFQDAQTLERFPEIPRAQFEKSVHVIQPDGRVFFGAEAVFLSLAQSRNFQW